MVNQNNCKKPNYKIDDKEIYFDIYVSPDKEVCIIGSLDNNYICWTSITILDESDLIVTIIDYILKRKPVMVSSISCALGFRYEEVMKWHKFRISKKLYSDGEYRYYSQASPAYLGDNEMYLAKYMSGEINRFYYLELSKCKYRLMDSYYFKILEGYKKLLTQKENYEYYYEMKPLISLLKSESYLKLSPNEEIRNIYLDCMKECSNLYNRYMSSVR
ncbi:hypothetical protein [Peribacillus frigoritolerans]|uniref:hypothetical protein n=1 Tax=Peribacillus frigoritolerans TaxID=450367 RepID=UPI0010711649|nr:hypothetical protein [Peribacillus frigoritolerans]TFH58578.1 hypothetical protein E4J71_24020 [Peribacillus frigoritolerans]